LQKEDKACCLLTVSNHTDEPSNLFCSGNHVHLWNLEVSAFLHKNHGIAANGCVIEAAKNISNI